MNWLQKLFAGSLITALQEEVSLNHEEINALKRSLALKQESLLAKSQEVEEKSNECLLATQKLGSVQREAVALVNDLKDARNSISLHEAEVKRLQSLCNQLEQEKTTLVEANVALTKSHAETTQKLINKRPANRKKDDGKTN